MKPIFLTILLLLISPLPSFASFAIPKPVTPIDSITSSATVTGESGLQHLERLSTLKLSSDTSSAGAQPEKSGLSKRGFLLGLISSACTVLTILALNASLGLLAAGFWALAVGCGIWGIQTSRRAIKQHQHRKGFAIAGLALSMYGLIFSGVIAFLVLLFSLFGH